MYIRTIALIHLPAPWLYPQIGGSNTFKNSIYQYKLHYIIDVLQLPVPSTWNCTSKDIWNLNINQLIFAMEISKNHKVQYFILHLIEFMWKKLIIWYNACYPATFLIVPITIFLFSNYGHDFQLYIILLIFFTSIGSNTV